MATPRAAKHRDLEQRLEDLETGLRRVSHGTLVLRERTITIPDVLFANDEPFTVVTPGNQAIQLNHIPIPGSLHVYWGVLHIPGSLVSVDLEGLVTVSDPGGMFPAGAVLEPYYAHRGETPPPPGAGGFDFGSTWKYKQIGRTATDDYSASSYDDSGWASSAAPFGESNPAGRITDLTGWPTEATTWDQTTRLWVRKTVAATAGVDLSVTVRLNRYVTIYLNGVEVVGPQTQITTQVTYTIPGASVLASNVLAIKVTDDAFDGTNTGCYFDVKVDQ